MAQKINCSVNIICRNNADFIERSLESVKDFADICVADGGSNDGTLEKCEAAGARIFQQPSEFLDEDGRIIHFANVRNFLISKSKFDWVLVLDADEYFTKDFVNEVAEIVRSSEHHIVYNVSRKYLIDETVIESASTYPMLQIRLAHKYSNRGYVREIHEGWDLKEDTEIKICKNHLVAKYPEYDEMIAKWRYYININTTVRHKDMPIDYENFFRGTLINYSKSAIFITRKVIMYRLIGEKPYMPIRYELAKIWYQYAAATSIMRNIFKRDLLKVFGRNR